MDPYYLIGIIAAGSPTTQPSGKFGITKFRSRPVFKECRARLKNTLKTTANEPRTVFERNANKFPEKFETDSSGLTCARYRVT